ncbi:hypothetical protein F5Y19DRAFT_493528 [Xylariaceae sp. FL1651]|nr:hypothetical protein F5Y19DRAFT_493528 [Xylariaceae sp. FL1651]
MPKRKKRHAVRVQQRAEAKMAARRQEQQRQASRQPQPRPHQKRGHIQPSEEINLGTRLAALPPELRAEIFAWVLVRPVKWSAPHIAPCPLLSPELTATPFRDIRPRLNFAQATCASVYRPRATKWRHRTKPIHTNPWRSTWAPEVRNEFLCSDCWDHNHRPGPLPRVDSLPCLCARGRRAEGLAALLVCRSWYEEGARVLYTRNVFAFASPEECVEFFGALSPRWRALISKVSLQALAPTGVYPESAAEELERVEVDPRALYAAWNFLSRLPALSELELDAVFLARPECVRVFRGASLKALRKITFTQSTPMDPYEAPRGFVWPRRAHRRLVEDSSFAEDVARCIKGWRYGWVRGQARGDEQQAVEEQRRYRSRFETAVRKDSPKSDKVDTIHVGSGS